MDMPQQDGATQMDDEPAETEMKKLLNEVGDILKKSNRAKAIEARMTFVADVARRNFARVFGTYDDPVEMQRVARACVVGAEALADAMEEHMKAVLAKDEAE